MNEKAAGRYLFAQSDASSPLFNYDAKMIQTDAGPRCAALMRPVRARQISEAQLPALESTTKPDESLLEAARAIDPPPAMWLMCARGESPDHYWRLDPMLGDSRSGVAHAMLRAHLPTYRELYAMGVALIVHLELEPDDVQAFRDAARALAHDTSDRHLLMVATQFTTMSLQKFEASSFVRQFRVYARKATRMTGTFAAIRGD